MTQNRKNEDTRKSFATLSFPFSPTKKNMSAPLDQTEADLLQLEATIMLGPDEKFYFYHPVQFQNFVLKCWRRSLSVGYGCSIYENGSVISLSSDPRFRNLSWSLMAKIGTLGRRDLKKLLCDVQKC